MSMVLDGGNVLRNLSISDCENESVDATEAVSLAVVASLTILSDLFKSGADNSRSGAD